MVSTSLLALQVVVPLVSAPVCSLMRRGRLAWALALAVSWAVLIMAVQVVQGVLEHGTLVYVIGGWAAPWGIEYRVDALSAFMVLMIGIIASAVMTFAHPTVVAEVPRERVVLFYTCYLLCLTGLLGIVVTGDAFNLFVFLEVSSLSSYVLVSLGRGRQALTAAFQYLVMGTIGATFILIGVGLLYMMTGTLNMADLAGRLPALTGNRTVIVAFAFITVGTSLKLALFPLHLWLPNAYTFAPSAVSAFLAATATKVGVYMLLRFFYTVFGAEFSFDTMQAGTILAPLAVIAALVASTVALFQEDLKRMLAYSSIAQIGYMMLGISLGTAAGVGAGVIHLFNHALMKGALFLALGCVFLRAGSMLLHDLAGIGRTMPLTMAAFVVGGLSLIGVPLTAGFISKWYLLQALLEGGRVVLAVLVLVSSLIAVAYVWRVLEMAYFRAPGVRARTATEAPAVMLVPTWVLILCNLYLGVNTEFSSGMSHRAAMALLGIAREPARRVARAADARRSGGVMRPDVVAQVAVLLPLVGALLIWMSRSLPNQRETVTLVTAALLAGLVASLLPGVMAGERPAAVLVQTLPGMPLALEVEPLGLLFALVASVLWLVTSVYSIGYMRGNEERNQTRFYVCFAVALSGAIGVAFAANLFTLFVFYEVLTLSTYPLVTHAGTEEARRGGRVYLGLLLSTSIGLLLLAVLWTWSLAGTLDFRPGGILAGTASPAALAVLLALYMFGIGKAALMPVHRWLPAAMVAPTPVSALLHAVAVVKAGVFTVVKVVVYVFGLDLLNAESSTHWLLYAAGASILIASLVALRQDNLKRRLAYSTVSQLSYVTLAAAILAPISIAAAAMHIAAHAFAKITLFFAAGSIYTAAHKTEVSQLDGIGRRMPWTMGAFAVASLSMIGVPPTAGFLSKWYMLMGALETGKVLAVAVLVVSTLLNAAYFLPVVYRAFLKPLPAHGGGHDAPHGEAPLPIVVALTVTAAGTVLMFFWPDVPLGLALQLGEAAR